MECGMNLPGGPSQESIEALAQQVVSVTVSGFPGISGYRSEHSHVLKRSMRMSETNHQATKRAHHFSC
jgi:hypothetical protein